MFAMLLWGTLFATVTDGLCSVGDREACGPGRFCAATFDLATEACPAEGVCQPLPASPTLPLALPVPAGATVTCVHGVLRDRGDTHSTCSEDRRFAVDVASLAFDPPNLVLASADGVAHAWGDCASTDLNHAPPDRTCNRGLGNVVQIQHEGGVFTQYAHLSAIFVSPREPVRRGQPIGVEGNSGAAGAKHIHFSLHRGDASRLDPAPSLPIRRLRARGKVIDTLALGCGRGGYGPRDAEVLTSDNRRLRSEPRIGFRPPARLAIESAVGKIFEPSTRPGAINVLRATRGEVLADYWLAVALELDGRTEEARGLFLAQTKTTMGPAWVRRWSWLRLADMDVAAGRPADARRALASAHSVAAPPDTDFLRFADWVRREIERLDRR